MSDKYAVLTENQKDFLNFMKTKYSLFHLSNVFFRDLHYGVMAYLNLKGLRYGYSEAETLTHQLIKSWQEQEILTKIDTRAFMLNYPDFKKPLVKPATPAKPAAKAAALAAKPVAPTQSALPAKSAVTMTDPAKSGSAGKTEETAKPEATGEAKKG